jgi:hypothetical protein
MHGKRLIVIDSKRSMTAIACGKAPLWKSYAGPPELAPRSLDCSSIMHAPAMLAASM